jgi:hypothetical protein
LNRPQDTWNWGWNWGQKMNGVLFWRIAIPALILAAAWKAGFFG